MQFMIFAGPVFSTEQVVLFSVITLSLLGLAVGIVVFLIRKFLFSKNKKNSSNKSMSMKSVLTGIFIVFMVLLVFGIIPTVIKDNSWNRKQDDCAEQVGYTSPGDNNSNRATFASQSAYRTCLETK